MYVCEAQMYKFYAVCLRTYVACVTSKLDGSDNNIK